MKKIMLIVSLFFFTGIISIYSSVIQNYGHRGCRGLMPENTIPAYQKAMELGVDFVDMDVNMTKDGVVVVAHDTYLNPDFTKNENGNWLDSKKKIYIKDLNFAELEKYTVGEAKPGTKRALIFKDEKNIPNIHIPTLTDCIKYVKKWNAEHGTNIKINIEMKTYPFGIAHSTPSLKMAKAVYKIIKEERMSLIHKLADLNIEHDSGGPFAAGVFESETGKIVSIGVNRVMPGNCSSAHAEIMAISLAQNKLGTYDLGGKGLPKHDLVVNWLPCTMCFGALIWSGTRRLIIAGSGPELEEITAFDEGPRPENWIEELNRRGIEVINNILRKDAIKTFKHFRDSNKYIYNARQSNQ